MAFERKASAPASTAATAATATSKKGKETQSVVWLNFVVSVETKKGIKRTSAGVSMDSILKRIFGDNWESEVKLFSEEQLAGICTKISFSDLTINVTTPVESSSYEDNF